jgi:beta-lactamase regulating signal transducer with metallopeptidase domain
MFFIPVILDQLHRLWWPETASLWVVNGLASCAGSLFGNYPTDREICPRLNFRAWLAETSAAWGFQYAAWFVLIAAAIFMPGEWGGAMAAVIVLFLLLHFAVQFGLFLRYLRWTRFIHPPEIRLARLVENTSSRLGVKPGAAWQMAGVQAAAFAFPITGDLVFSTRLLEICTDEEVAAVCAHEMAHLTESRVVLAGRLVGSLVLFPLIFLNPLILRFGIFGLLMAYGGMLALGRLTRWISQRMEKRADRFAVASQLNEGAYARALEKIYRENLLPAVNTNNQQTHPHLYDRLLAAGITPAYPRPARARKLTWVGFVYAVTLGILIATVALRDAFDTVK